MSEYDFSGIVWLAILGIIFVLLLIVALPFVVYYLFNHVQVIIK